MPSYRLESQLPFNKEKCERLLKSQVDMALEDFVYSPSDAEALAITLSQTILAKVKDWNLDRYVNIELK